MTNPDSPTLAQILLGAFGLIGLVWIFVVVTVKRFEREDRQLRSVEDEDRIQRWEGDDAA